MITLRKILLFLPILFLAFSCQDDMEDVVNDDDDNQDDSDVNIVEMTVGNSGSTAYFVSEVIGNEDVTTLNEENSTWELTVGTRYELTVTGASAHPFALRDSENNILLSMNDIDGSFEADSEVDFQTSGTSFNFTLTQDLADEINNYICTVHPSMTGRITVN
ncbi:MAG: cupredoxin domain-containing protein [Bacteroidota bacterium]